MPDSPSERSAGPRGAGGGVAYLDHALWRQLTEAGTAEEFCRGWLRLQCRMIGEVKSGGVVMGPADAGPFTPLASWPDGLRDVSHFSAVVERVVAERKGVVTRSGADTTPEAAGESPFHLGYPVLGNGRLHGVVALEIDPRSPVELQSAMRQLQWGVPWLENRVLRREAEPESRLRQRLAAVLDLAAIALQEERFPAAATAFVTELATRLGCDRVSLGILRGRHIRVRALSHTARIGKEMNLHRAIGAAMDEAAEQQATLLFPAPEPPENGRLILRAHAELAARHGSGAVCTVPVAGQGGGNQAALTLERGAAAPFDAETVELVEAAAALVVPVLEEKRRNDRLLAAKAAEAFRRQAEKLVGRGHATLKLIVAALAGLAVFFTFATGEYRVTARSTLEGAVRRVVAAPYGGYIAEAGARAGDVVRQGQVLCTLDDRDRHLEFLRLTSQREQHLLEHRKAMAEGETARTKILLEQKNQAEAQLALLSEQLQRARILAPFDGIVVSGDLSQSLGAPVEPGQVLFEVAPLASYRVKIEVDERDIARIRAGQKGDIVLTAMPETHFPFTVEKITPVSMTREGVNVFLVEARLDRMSERLRPGMEGFGKVAAGRRRLIWIWTHSLIDWVRLKAWSLWP